MSVVCFSSFLASALLDDLARFDSFGDNWRFDGSGSLLLFDFGFFSPDLVVSVSVFGFSWRFLPFSGFSFATDSASFGVSFFFFAFPSPCCWIFGIDFASFAAAPVPLPADFERLLPE